MINGFKNRYGALHALLYKSDGTKSGQEKVWAYYSTNDAVVTCEVMYDSSFHAEKEYTALLRTSLYGKHWMEWIPLDEWPQERKVAAICRKFLRDIDQLV